jgi:hypothetical protein
MVDEEGRRKEMKGGERRGRLVAGYGGEGGVEDRSVGVNA